MKLKCFQTIWSWKWKFIKFSTSMKDEGGVYSFLLSGKLNWKVCSWKCKFSTSMKVVSLYLPTLWKVWRWKWKFIKFSKSMKVVSLYLPTLWKAWSWKYKFSTSMKVVSLILSVCWAPLSLRGAATINIYFYRCHCHHSLLFHNYF